MYLIPYSKLEKKFKLQNPAVISLWDKSAPVPPQFAVVYKESLTQDNGNIDAQALIEKSQNDFEYAVTKEFTADALNNINSLYYGSCVDAFAKKSSLATFFVKNRMGQYVLLKCMLDRISCPTITIKELCCGAVYSRWQHFDKFLPTGRRMEAILSDFSDAIIPKNDIDCLNLNNVSFAYESYNLKESLVETDKKVDVMFVTYGFDSVWIEGDAMYVKQNNEWFEIKYRVKVLPTSTNPELMLGYLRQGHTQDPVYLSDFDDVAIETIAQKVDILNVPYGLYVNRLYGSYAEARTNIPGGIIKRVQEAFDKQMKPGGIFVIGEVATYPIKQGEEIDLTIVDYNTTGRVGKYKVEDFYLAEAILSDLGFKVEVLDMQKEAKKLGKEIDEDTEDTWLMLVSHP
ncbi:MAG: hypothetical protein M3P33_04150 [bacterium]|nr:hypothetical protein [bacterium]